MAAGFVSLFVLAAAASAADSTAERALAILRDNCQQCHTKALAMSGLDLTARPAMLQGGSRGPAVIPGNASQSRLMEAVERKGKLAMPPTRALAEADAALLRKWIEEGAAWPGSAVSRPVVTWWSFQKVVRPAVPRSGNAWARNEIDEFILEKLSANKLKPSAPAGRATLARRVYLDLWGLPPTAAQIREFVDDPSPEAWPKLVNRLLDSPHYGEKWGRHWLDLVRYSDTAGFELDSYIHDAWRYRDWVIDSINGDKPYDQFIREQIAADELSPEDPVARTGTGLFCVGPNRELFPDQADINREETLTDYVDTTSAVFLGLTAGCARCHDHKFDPISQEDYYRVRAVFAPAVKTKVALDRLTSLGFDVGESVREWKLREIGEQIRAVQARCRNEAAAPKSKGRVNDDAIRACMTPQETAKLHEIEKWLVRLYTDYRPKPFACGLADSWNVAPRTFLPARGGRMEREVQPGFFSVLGGGEVPPPAEKREATGPIPLTPTTGRRTALAKWIADPANPLTARVMVNRVWQYHFGRGIVATPSDLGTRGGKPVHPELLDWLAVEFTANGWSLKRLHRVILNSAVYQQQSNPGGDAAARDPANLLLSHFTRRRLNADEIRDAILLTTGALNPKRGGRPVVPPLTEEEKATLTQRPDDAWVLTADASEHRRRSIYMIQKRTFRMPMMEVFDSPESMLTCPRRESSTTAPQSLTLFNGSFTVERARALAAELEAGAPSNEHLVRTLWTRILAREPDAEETARALAFLAAQSRNAGGRTNAAAELARALLNLNEFLYVD
ncbi:MAG: PSD1 and planctomycete cytochrome C domain-containing protein [Bryobacteraceae bacterium]|nr:PSD1 and planctomycete cytochrome C domain-containing protein [Bryobacteraceae bacterium]